MNSLNYTPRFPFFFTLFFRAAAAVAVVVVVLVVVRRDSRPDTANETANGRCVIF